MASVIRGSDNFDTADTGGGKALCTAWVNFDGTTTPPTIRDSYNVSQVIRTETGLYKVYFAQAMDNSNYTAVGSASYDTRVIQVRNGSTSEYVEVLCTFYNAAYNDDAIIRLQVFGGKN